MRVRVRACCWGLACFACMHELSVCVCGCNADTWSLSPPGSVFLYVTTVVMSACSKTAGYECLSACRSICLCCSMDACSIVGKVVRCTLLSVGTRGHHVTSARSYICRPYYILLYYFLLFRCRCRFGSHLV